MPENRDDWKPPAEFQKIMDSIDEITRSASLNQQGPSNFLQFGPLTTELERKLIDLKDMLNAYGRNQAK